MFASDLGRHQRAVEARSTRQRQPSPSWRRAARASRPDWRRCSIPSSAEGEEQGGRRPAQWASATGCTSPSTRAPKIIEAAAHDVLSALGKSDELLDIALKLEEHALSDVPLRRAQPVPGRGLLHRS
ncbi:hypothetical protein ACRAWF_40145 [Streptomyces sp. L7]